MNESFNISFEIIPSDATAPLGLEVWINDQKLFDNENITQTVFFKHNIELPDDQDHEFRLCLKNKKEEHTIVDDSGQIIKDSLLKIENLCFDDLLLGQILENNAVYEHDFNGTAPAIKTKFYQDLGCNGTVIMKFRTPIYLWMLENM